MKVKVLVIAFVAWLSIALGAILNGILRESTLIPAMGSGPAGVLSMAILLALILAVAAVAVAMPSWRGLSRRSLLAIGIVWALGSIAFEFFLGLVILDMSLAEVLAKYDMLKGELWPLAPVTMAFAPLLMRYAESAASRRWPLFSRFVAR